jgi:two-component system, NtrC family, sensor kinase
MTRQHTLTWRVLVILALAAVIPTVIVGALAIWRARADLEREVVRGNLALIRALGGALDATLQDARRSLELAAGGWADGRTTAPPVDDGDRRATERLLGRLRRQVSIVSSLSLVDPDGRVIAGDPVPRGVDSGFHSFGGYIGDAVFTGHRPVVVMAVQARSRTGELVGALVAELDLAFVGDALAAARLGPGAHLLVVDGAGIPVARSDRGPVGGSSLRGASAAVDRALGSSADGSVAAGGTIAVYRNLSSYQSLRGIRWAIVLEQPESDAYALARRTARDTLLAGAVALALALAIGSVLAARLTRPLSALADRADAIAGGDPAAGPPSPTGAPGEIGMLARRIDEMARRVAERAELQAALARGDRLATVGTMSAQVAHEINNPLTTVLGYARLLLEDKPADHPDRAGLELIASEADRMKAIVGGLLDYARAPQDPDGHGPADVAVVLRHVAALVEPQLRRGRVALALVVPDGLPPVAADAHGLQQVLVNLVQNAAQAMPSGGTVTATAEAAPANLAVVIRVADQGPGIAPAERARVFDPFVTSKEAGAGTGLGLAVCKHLVTTWGGSIEVGDAPGGGAELRVAIPAVRA